MNRAELEAKAKALGIEFTAETSDEDLTKAINEKDKKDTSEDLDFWKEEAKKAFQARDEAKQERRKLQSKISELEGKITDAPDLETLKTLKKELEDLKKFKTEIDKQKEEEELKTKTEVERIEINFKKQLNSLSTELERLRTERENEKKSFEETLNKERSEKARLRENKLEGDIIKFSAKYNALKPEQIVKLLKDDFTYDAELDKFVYPVKDAKGKLSDELSIEDRVKAFLNDPDNENLVKSKANTDGTGVTKSETVSVKKSGDKKYDPKDPDLVKAAYMKGVSVEDHIAQLKMRDEKFAKIRKESA